MGSMVWPPMRPEEDKLCHQPATSVTLPSVKKVQETEDAKSEKTWEDPRRVFKQWKSLLVEEMIIFVSLPRVEVKSVSARKTWASRWVVQHPSFPRLSGCSPESPTSREAPQGFQGPGHLVIFIRANFGLIHVCLILSVL